MACKFTELVLPNRESLWEFERNLQCLRTSKHLKGINCGAMYLNKKMKCSETIRTLSVADDTTLDITVRPGYIAPSSYMPIYSTTIAAWTANLIFGWACCTLSLAATVTVAGGELGILFVPTLPGIVQSMDAGAECFMRRRKPIVRGDVLASSFFYSYKTLLVQGLLNISDSTHHRSFHLQAWSS